MSHTAPSTLLFSQKLQRRGPLSARAIEALQALPVRQRRLAAGQDLIVQGEPTTTCCMIVEGWVSRIKSGRDGSQQIVAFHIPGDVVDLQSCLIMIADHGIRTHTPAIVNLIAHEDILSLAAAYPDLGRALWFDTLVDASIFREWTMNVGRRSAPQAVAHLLLELAYRLKAAGLSDGLSFDLPLTQADLADATGISIVHCNRSLQHLRRERLISTLGKRVTLDNVPGLVDLSDFDELYMHPEGSRKPAGPLFQAFQKSPPAALQ